MKIFDISLTTTSDIVTWPGDPGVELKRVKKMEEGSHSNVSQISMGVHTGTHVDAPYHFVANGGTVEGLSLDILIGPVQVIEIPESVNILTAEVLVEASMDESVDRVLFKTRNSNYWAQKPLGFQSDFVGISEDGARYLVEKGVKLVGIDYLSVAPYDQSVPTHYELLNGGVVAVEGLDLSEVPPGQYMLYCLPVKLGGSDGAPARVVLIAE